MPFFPKTQEELVANGLNALDQNTNITQLSPGGKARFFIETTSTEHASQQALFDLNLLQPYIQYSENKFLDFFGDMLNLPRIEATYAESDDDNFMFYVSSGTFGDINNGASFTIPAGTTVSTVQYQGTIVTPGLEQQPTVNYKTLEEVTCFPDETFVYVSIRADLEGKTSSVPKNVLNKHDFNTFLLGDTNILKCTNKFAIDNGDERERDPSYRYRLLQVFKSKEQAVRAALRLAALSVPGVSDVKMVNFEQGPGTYSIYLKGLTPTVSPQLIETVSSVVALVSAEGIRPFILAPNIIGMEFVIGINWKAKTNPEQITTEYNNIRNSLERYLDSRDIGETVEMDELVDIVLDAGPSILSIGKLMPNKFEEVLINRSAPDGNGSVRSRLFGQAVVPLYNERIILETSNNYRGIQFV